MTNMVLITGITGYIARHVALELLRGGYIVRGTVRNLAKGDALKNDLQQAGADISQLELVEADLLSDTGWDAAVRGCDYIQHMASPFPPEQPTDREALVPAARVGTQRVLAAGFAAGAQRIVLTSSLVAMMGQPGKGTYMKITEADWTDPEWRLLSPYDISKTRAELSAWEFAKVQGFEDRLTVVNPSLVLGPPVGTSYGTSLDLIERMFAGAFPRAPKISIAIVDVRDLARLFVAAMLNKKAAGRRLIGASETLWFSEIADVLHTLYPQKASKLPRGTLPNFIVRIAALFDRNTKIVLSSLGTFHDVDTSYVTEMTGITFRPARDTLRDTAKFLEEQGKI